jgi:hypothetical protein
MCALNLESNQLDNAYFILHACEACNVEILMILWSNFLYFPFFLCFEHWRNRWAIRERGSDANLCLIPPAPPVKYLSSFSHWTPPYISTSSDREFNIQMKKSLCLFPWFCHCVVSLLDLSHACMHAGVCAVTKQATAILAPRQKQYSSVLLAS